MEEKTDDEGVDSIKTSVESLKEANDNNSNNNSEQTGWYYVTLILAVFVFIHLPILYNT